MSIWNFKGGLAGCPINCPEAMLKVIRELGIVPFFANAIEGFSIEEFTAPGYWFDDEDGELGPWDWKIDVVQTGVTAYGKYLFGGKAAFATVDWYRELMNYRRSLAKCQPQGIDKEVFEAIVSAGSIQPSELRKQFKIKKNQIDKIITHLEFSTLVVVGDITRVYRGPDLHYSGWQRSSVCTPEALFDLGKASCDRMPDERGPGDRFALEPDGGGQSFEEIFFGTKSRKHASEVGQVRTPEESFHLLYDHVKELFPAATDRQIKRLLG